MATFLGIVLLLVTPHLGIGPDQPSGENGGRALLLDVSSHQGSINWQSVASSGISGVYHKLSEGEDFRDPSWSSARQRAIKRAGLHWGFYHFVRPRQRPAAREARWFHRQARLAGGWGRLRPALDIETTELGPRATGIYLADLLSAMRRLGTKRMLLYASPGWWESHVALVPRLRRELRGVRAWVAHWGVSEPTPLRGIQGWALHQYTASGRVPGIRGPVDVNKAPRLKKLFG